MYTWRNPCANRAFHSPGKRDGIRDSAVAGDSARELCCLFERRAPHKPLNALLSITEPPFQPHDRLAIGVETKMARLNDTGMHGTDRDLVEAFARGGHKLIRLG